MRQLLLILAFITSYCLMASAETIKLVPSATDSTRMDTVVVSEIDNAEEDTETNYAAYPDIPFKESIEDSTAIAIVATIAAIGLPFFVIIIIFWFRYKNKQMEYKLAAEALATGQPIPQTLLKNANKQDDTLMKKGIKNISLGIGLGVFLWILTKEGSIASIGFLIFCIGVGEVVTANVTRKENRNNVTGENRKEE